jgi:hypothetical protein
MIDLDSYFDALKAVWINRILSANPEIHAWVQIPLKYFNTFLIGENNFKFNFDSSVLFPNTNHLPCFYSEVFRSFNRAHATNVDTFQTNIRNEMIWANKFITKNIGKKKSVLFLRNWIRSGIVFVSDLKFVDGVLDHNFIYRCLQDKRNIHMEVVMIKSALLPYRNILRALGHANNNPHADGMNMVKSKHFYTKFIELKVEGVDTSCTFVVNNSNGYDESECFRNKVYIEKEIKLKEFNFKILHGILPCNYNLRRWKIRDSDECDLCARKQTIRHLLLECSYVQPLWNKLNEMYTINITFPVLLGCDRFFQFHSLCSLIAFIIYKEWLLLSLQNKRRSFPLSLDYFKSELQLRATIYRKCRAYKEIDFIHLDNFIESLV